MGSKLNQFLLVAGFSLLLPAISPQQILAETYIVDSTADNITADGNITLREAVNAASTNTIVGDAPAGDADGDIILFDSTVFATATITLAVSDLEITDDVTIDGLTGSGTGPTDVTIDAGGTSRHFAILNDVAGTVTLSDLTLLDGDGTGTTAGNDGLGGAIYVGTGSTVEITNADIQTSIASLNGGAIYNAGSNLTVTGTTLNSNDAQGAAATNGGGGIFNNGGSLTLSSMVVTNNTASGISGSGGGVFVNDGSVRVTGGDFNSNISNRAGGGIEISSASGTPEVSILSVDFDGNTTGANPGNGGAIHVTAGTTANAAMVEVVAGTFSNNIAANEGGGLWNDLMGTMTVDGAVISDNTASGASSDNGGGGIFNNGGTLSVSNTIINSNVADGAAGSGGGIFNDGGTLTVTGGSILSNTAIRAGGGIEVATSTTASTVSLDSVTISSNTAGNAPGNGGGVHISDAAGDNQSLFSITGGTVSNNIANQEGGGLWNDAGGIMTIDGTQILGNVAVAANDAADAQGGGGIFNNGGQVTVQGGAVISFNMVTGSASAGTDDGGGAIFNDGHNTAGATVTVSDTVMEGNMALSAMHNGGAVINVAGANADTTVEISNSTLSGNMTARAGGAVENFGGDVTVLSSTLDLNTAGINGGAIHVSGAGVTGLSLSTVSDNVAGNEGGGLWNSSSATAIMTLSQTTVSENSAVTGGGLFNDGADGTINLSNVTVSGNSALAEGGGIDSEGGVLNLLNTTVANNTADDDSDGAGTGGGINVDTGTVTLINTIVAGNTDNTAAANDIFGTVTANSSLISDDTGATVTGTGNATNVDALLDVLADYGGAVFTHALLTGSPAIDSGSDADCLAEDARSFVRPQDGDQNGTAICDMGAFELGFDCNSNGVLDTTDIANGTSTDCDTNAIPDDCQMDGDSDGTIDSCDDCPSDSGKVAPGDCGCGVADVDSNANGVSDCLINPEAKAQIAALLSQVRDLRKKSSAQVRQDIRSASTALLNFVIDNLDDIEKERPRENLRRLARRVDRTVRRATIPQIRRFKMKKRRARRALIKLNNAVAE